DRKPLISGNWKMNHNHFEAIQTVQKLAYAIEKDDYEACDVSVHPPFTDLRSVQTVLQADSIPISLGAQNVHQAEKGAFTGEVSAGMLDKLDVKYVIVGHSERRELFGETDEVVNAKAIAVLQAGMTPIVCVGETLEQRTSGQAQDTVTEQLAGSLAALKPEIVADLVVAYEPIWAIGTGETATPADAQEMCAHIRARIAETFGDAAAASVRIQYGGSVKPGNAPELMAQPDIDGALVGGASLDADDFARIVKYRIYQA
ncbi:MAG: triose-phosphate isomerase, partial [Actinomycetota bacterium]